MPAGQDDISRKLGLGPHKRPRRGWIIGLAVVIAAGAGWFFWSSEDENGQVQYVTEAVARADLEVVVSATGTVEPTDQVDISSELSGTVEAVLVDFNDEVEKGTVLALLDTAKLEAQKAVRMASLDSAIAKVAMAQATLKQAREEYQRGLQLEERGVESPGALIVQEAAFERAQADLQSAMASRELAAANLDLVQVDLDKSRIVSPVRGIVLDRAVDEGQIVAATLSAPVLFTVAEDLARMEVQVDIDEADISRVDVGQQASFTVEAYDDRVFPAAITEVRFAPETVDGVVTYKGILTLDNSDMALRPGMTATADIVVASVEDALVVPNAALRYSPPAEAGGSGGGSGLVGMILPSGPGRQSGQGNEKSRTRTVWILGEDWSPAEIEVEVGDTDGSFTVILSGNLAEGDKVITDRIDVE